MSLWFPIRDPVDDRLWGGGPAGPKAGACGSRLAVDEEPRSSTSHQAAAGEERDGETDGYRRRPRRWGFPKPWPLYSQVVGEHVLAAFDAKEFRRGGDRRPTRLGEERTAGGFFTQLSAGVIIDDEEAFTDAFVSSFDDQIEDEDLDVLGQFCSSYALRRHCGEDTDRARAIAQKVIEDTEEHIEAVRLNYPYLSPERVQVIRAGGRKGKQEEFSPHHFLRRLGNYMPVISSWWYLEDENVETADEIRLDHVEMPVVGAWSELREERRPLIVPNGDECDPTIAAADLIAAITDHRLSEERLQIRPNHLEDVWDDAAFDVEAFFFDHRFLHAMTWKDSASVHTGGYWKRPMVFLMVASTLVVDEADLAAEGAEDLAETVRLRDWVEEKGWMNTVLAYAQEMGGGAKSYNSGDRKYVTDGDTLVCVGEHSIKRARDLATAVDIEVLELKDLRKKMGQ